MPPSLPRSCILSINLLDGFFTASNRETWGTRRLLSYFANMNNYFCWNSRTRLVDLGRF